jgi:hypothetical protein
VTRFASGAHRLRARIEAGADLTADPGATVPDLPDYVVQTLARLRLLHDVPFQYLVADPGLLPPDSARFFHLDTRWLDQLCLGALSVGAGGTREQAQAELAPGPVRQALGKQLPLVRDLQRGRLVLETALEEATDEIDPDADVTGVLIRSALISGWPSLQLRAYSTDDETKVPPGADPSQLDPSLSVPILRMELLAPSVLIVLFAGVPRMIWLEEPHHGIQFGVEEAQGGSGYQIVPRGEDGTEAVGPAIPVQMRSVGAARNVVDVKGFAAAVAGERGLAASAVGSAQVALQLMRAPVRQRFTAGQKP